MKFSLFFEMQISHPTPREERAMFHAAVEQAVLADELGYHAVWAVEHHGLYEYSHSSAPEVFLSFVAARTRRIGIGHGVTLLPYPYNHPIRVAERIATLDILSGGRVLWGSGKSSSRVEQRAFDVDLDTLDAQWLEAISIIPRMWREDVFEFRGRFFDVPPTQVVPKPVQEPHPPMFAACARPESAARVGALGLGALNFALGRQEELEALVAGYRRAASRPTPVGSVATNHIACTPPALILDDDRTACEHGFRAARFFGDALDAYYPGESRPVGPLNVRRDPLSPGGLDRARAARGTPADTVHALVGDPAFAHEYVQQFQRIGVDELILVMQMGTLPTDLVLESVRTFGEKVLPHYV